MPVHAVILQFSDSVGLKLNLYGGRECAKNATTRRGRDLKFVPRGKIIYCYYSRKGGGGRGGCLIMCSYREMGINWFFFFFFPLVVYGRILVAACCSTRNPRVILLPIWSGFR